MIKKRIIFILLAFIILLSGCTKGPSKDMVEATQPITLDYWRVWDGPDDFKEILNKYKEIHPFVTINYRKLRYDEYEKELLNAMAEDRAPDIFSIHNTWMEKYKTKITPLPSEITMAYASKASADGKTKIEIKNKKSLALVDLKNQFIETVYDNVVLLDGEEKNLQEKIFGLPLAVDSLAMYYNRDLFNNAGIPNPPRYWNREFQQNVKKLTKQDRKGEIIQSGVSFGGSSNIERYSDILSVLMMQNGTVMMDEKAVVRFHEIPSYLSKDRNPGQEALRFYTDFSNPGKEVYCWNEQLDNSLDLFIQGKLAMFFGYAYHLPTIKARAPKLNFSITTLPQIENSSQSVNFANFWVEVVSKKSEHSEEAWDFVQFASDKENVISYLDKTKNLTALKELISEQSDNLEINPFAHQLLTAKSWYKGKNVQAAELIFKQMIDYVINGEKMPEESMVFGAKAVQETIK